MKYICSSTSALTCSLKTLLWLFSATVLFFGLLPVFRLPVQGDDLQLLFSYGSPNQYHIFSTAYGAAEGALSRFLHGETEHFIPIGHFLDAIIKTTMLNSWRLGIDATFVQNSAMYVISISTLVVVSSFIQKRLKVANLSFTTGQISSILVIAFMASSQITTIWSIYDPMNVHPIYGAFTVLIGFAYLNNLEGLKQYTNTRSALSAMVISIIGVMTYEYFLVFMFVGILGLCKFIFNIKELKNLAYFAIAVIPAVMLFLITRIYSALTSVSTYEGTNLGFGLKQITAWIEAIHSSIPGATIGRVFTMTDPNTFPWKFGALVLFFSIISFTIFLITTRFSAEKTDRSLKSAILEPLFPLILLVIFMPVLFAFSSQWATYLIAGNQYLDAIGSYWTWAAIIATTYLALIVKIKNLLVVIMFLGALSLSASFQSTFNWMAATAEVAYPTPYGTDFLYSFDNPLSEEENCNSLFAQSSSWWQQPQTLTNINTLTLERTGAPFCEWTPQ